MPDFDEGQNERLRKRMLDWIAANGGKKATLARALKISGASLHGILTNGGASYATVQRFAEIVGSTVEDVLGPPGAVVARAGLRSIPGSGAPRRGGLATTQKLDAIMAMAWAQGFDPKFLETLHVPREELEARSADELWSLVKADVICWHADGVHITIFQAKMPKPGSPANAPSALETRRLVRDTVDELDEIAPPHEHAEPPAEAPSRPRSTDRGDGRS